ncbi:MAG: hypothetical protein ACRC8P_03295, partial [Spiroplasma sp.]
MRKLVKLMAVTTIVTIASLQVTACKDDSKYNSFISEEYQQLKDWLEKQKEETFNYLKNLQDKSDTIINQKIVDALKDFVARIDKEIVAAFKDFSVGIEQKIEQKIENVRKDSDARIEQKIENVRKDSDARIDKEIVAAFKDFSVGIEQKIEQKIENVRKDS